MNSLLFNIAFAFYVVGLFHSSVAFLFKRDVFFRVALAAVVIGFLFHTGFLLLVGFESAFYPAGLRESLAFLAWTVSLCFLIAYWRYRQIQALGFFLLPLVVVLMLGTVFVKASPIPDILRSFWVYAHATFMILAHGLLLVALVAGLLYRLEERELKNKKPRRFYDRLPPLEVLDNLFQVSLLIGFGFMTLGLLTGILFAEREWAANWYEDPNSLVSLITWGIYLLLVYMRLSAGWRGRKAVWISALGYLFILSAYVGATFLGGLHRF